MLLEGTRTRTALKSGCAHGRTWLLARSSQTVMPGALRRHSVTSSTVTCSTTSKGSGRSRKGSEKGGETYLDHLSHSAAPRPTLTLQSERDRMIGRSRKRECNTLCEHTL